jgi:cyclopropane fatty-acyl-phospholipid synthase-like methyltransferase
VTFTESDVREFFDQTLDTYLAFWDSDGVLHTGYFAGGRRIAGSADGRQIAGSAGGSQIAGSADDADEDYRTAADRTSEIIVADAGLDGSSYVLDVGCGCGNFLMGIARRFGCRGVGLDLSEERIKFAREKLAAEPSLDGVRFDHGSATGMPYPDNEFSQVVSQDALFLVPDKPRTHAEVYRVLRPGGVFAFSDFLQPKPQISERARRHVYDRVRWNGGYSFLGYQQALTEAGFEMMLARNAADHLRQTYRVLGRTAKQTAQTTKDPAERDWMFAFSESCQQIQVAIDDGEFGWGIFVARKPVQGTP